MWLIIMNLNYQQFRESCLVEAKSVHIRPNRIRGTGCANA
jgi:hypothetical protein